MKQKQHITFFTPTMQRTGSELVLLNLLNHLEENFTATVVSKYKGPLLSLLPSTIQSSYLYSKQPINFLSKLINKIKAVFVTPFVLKRYKNSIWYINTIVMPDILRYAIKYQIKVILHVHELDQMFDLLNEEQLQEVVHYPHLIIANSNCTKQLVQKHGRTQSIEICYPAFDTKKIFEDLAVKQKYRSQLHVSQDEFLWVMCGSLDKNKNPLLFIDIANYVLKQRLNVKFMWIGNTQDRKYTSKCKKYAIEKGISNFLLWLENAEEDYLNYFKCADGFVLTSEKESFSMVTLEALLLGIPVVVNDCGGVTEILQNDVGSVVSEKNSVLGFAEPILKYMSKELDHHHQKGIQRAQQFDIAIWSKQWNKILNDSFKSN